MFIFPKTLMIGAGLPLMEAAAGHRFLCVSTALPQLVAAARTFAAARPHVYSAAVPGGGPAMESGLARQAGPAGSGGPEKDPSEEHAAGEGEPWGGLNYDAATANLAGELAAAAEVRGDARGVAWDAEFVSLAGARDAQAVDLHAMMNSKGGRLHIRAQLMARQWSPGRGKVLTLKKIVTSSHALHQEGTSP